MWGSIGKCEAGREKCVCVRGWVSEGGTGPSGCPQPASHLAQGINPHLPNHCTPVRWFKGGGSAPFTHKGVSPAFIIGKLPPRPAAACGTHTDATAVPSAGGRARAPFPDARSGVVRPGKPSQTTQPPPKHSLCLDHTRRARDACFCSRELPLAGGAVGLAPAVIGDQDNCGS